MTAGSVLASILTAWPEVVVGRCFQCLAVPGGPAVAPGGRGSTGPGVSLSVAVPSVQRLLSPHPGR